MAKKLSDALGDQLDAPRPTPAPDRRFLTGPWRPPTLHQQLVASLVERGVDPQTLSTEDSPSDPSTYSVRTNESLPPSDVVEAIHADFNAAMRTVEREIGEKALALARPTTTAGAWACQACEKALQGAERNGSLCKACGGKLQAAFESVTLGPGVPILAVTPQGVVGRDPSLDEVRALLPFGFLSGAAGSGKTWLARELAKQEGDKAVLACTTGVAAVNLGDATTINSLLGYFDTASLMQNYASGFLAYRLRALRKSGVRLIVLDEVSMMEGDQLDILCAALDDIDLKRTYDQDLGQVSLEADDDFRMRLLLVGDFAQLPPVSGGFAFASSSWDRFHEHTLRLTRIRRQGAPEFVEALQAVRRGDGAAALGTLRPCITDTLDLTFPGATLVASNASVDRINALRHMKLPGLMLEWPTQRSGEQQKDWVRLIPEVLQVKVGALVMLLANKPYPKIDPTELTQFEYVNGDLATVLRLEKEGVRVYLHRTLEEKVIAPYVKEWKEATGKKTPKWTIKGAVTYMPMRLAWATTVHKSQGLSMDQVQVSIVDGMFMKPSMLYVALSRARTLEGLRIVGTEKQLVGRATVDERVRPWL